MKKETGSLAMGAPPPNPPRFFAFAPGFLAGKSEIVSLSPNPGR